MTGVNERTECVWPPAPAGPREWTQRALALLALALAATVLFSPSPGGALGCVLAGFLAALICAVMELLTKLPAEPAGQVLTRGRGREGRSRGWMAQPADEGGRLDEYSPLDADSFAQLVGVPTRARVRR